MKETSKPADLLNMCDCDRDAAAPHSNDCQLTKWQMAHGGGESGAMGAPTRWEDGWPSDVEFLTPQQAAALLNRHISEVERLTKEIEQHKIDEERRNKECLCFWCGQIFPLRRDGTRDEKADDLTAHAMTCAENPWHKQFARAEAAESKLSQLHGALKLQKAEIARIYKELGEIQARNEKKDQLGILGMTIGMRMRLGDTEKEIAAILNGGQS